MKDILKIILLLFLILTLTACQGGAAKPAAVASEGVTQSAQVAEPGTGTSGNTTSGADPQNSTSGAPAAPSASPTPRPTTPAVESRAAQYPVFEGLYWTKEVGVKMSGPTQAELLSPLSCDNLLSLLSSGEWRLVQHYPAPEQQRGMASTLALLARGDQLALVDLREMSLSASAETGETAPEEAEADASAAPAFPGCVGKIEIAPLQQITAEGVEQAQGEARVYPWSTGCQVVEGVVQLSLFYEGPQDLRALLSFSVPEQVGKFPINPEDASLTTFRSEMSMIEILALSYTQSPSGEMSSLEAQSVEFLPTGDPGRVTVSAVAPLTGEIELHGWSSDQGTQSLKAGFQCSPKK